MSLLHRYTCAQIEAASKKSQEPSTGPFRARRAPLRARHTWQETLPLKWCEKASSLYPCQRLRCRRIHSMWSPGSAIRQDSAQWEVHGITLMRAAADQPRSQLSLAQVYHT
jgi:hypothetical protein